MVEESFVPTVFTHNRGRLIVHDAAGEFLRAIVEQARKARLMSSEHFTVDGTLIESWASLKSFKRKDGGNDTHESTTDPDAKLARKGKGKEAKLSYSAHALIENRNTSRGPVGAQAGGLGRDPSGGACAARGRAPFARRAPTGPREGSCIRVPA